jgi:hypothetical protein
MCMHSMERVLRIAVILSTFSVESQVLIQNLDLARNAKPVWEARGSSNSKASATACAQRITSPQVGLISLSSEHFTSSQSIPSSFCRVVFTFLILLGNTPGLFCDKIYRFLKAASVSRSLPSVA